MKTKKGTLGKFVDVISGAWDVIREISPRAEKLHKFIDGPLDTQNQSRKKPGEE